MPITLTMVSHLTPSNILMSFSPFCGSLAGRVSRLNQSPTALNLCPTQALPIPLWWQWAPQSTHPQWL